MTSAPESKQRLSKIMTLQGFCSRREADHLIAQGWVSVDGQPAKQLGIKIYPGQQITLSPEAQAYLQGSVTFLLNKPMGYVSAQPEKKYLPAVSLITPANRYHGDHSGTVFSPAHVKGLAPAGRLDIDSQGLLVLTQDGRVAKRLIGSGSAIEKEYIVRVQGHVTPTALRRLHSGIRLDGKALRPAIVIQQHPQLLQFILTEGKKRQIRRMCQCVGLEVTKLKRVRIGKIKLGALPVGQWRYLKKSETF